MISIIIPVYNVQTYLDECVNSIVSQSYCNLEIILVDDGSTDSSGKMCDLWLEKDSRIKVVHKLNGGLSSARNTGIEVAKGDYIAFVDSDDFVDKLMYESLLNILEKTSDIDVASCGIEQFRDENYLDVRIFLNCFDREFSVMEYIKLILEHEIDNAVWNKLYRRTAISQTRFKEGQINEDILFNLEILSKINKLAYISNAYYKYRIRKGSITQQANPKLFDFIDNAFYMRKRILEDMKLGLSLEMEGYIYHEMTNYISTIEKYKSVALYKNQVNYCKRYILSHPILSFMNKFWSTKQKIKFALVSSFPIVYRFLLAIK